MSTLDFLARTGIALIAVQMLIVAVEKTIIKIRSAELSTRTVFNVNMSAVGAQDAVDLLRLLSARGGQR